MGFAVINTDDIGRSNDNTDVEITLLSTNIITVSILINNKVSINEAMLVCTGFDGNMKFMTYRKASGKFILVVVFSSMKTSFID